MKIWAQTSRPGVKKLGAGKLLGSDEFESVACGFEVECKLFEKRSSVGNLSGAASAPGVDDGLFEVENESGLSVNSFVGEKVFEVEPDDKD